MKKLTEELKKKLDFYRKLNISISKKMFKSSDLKRLKTFFGVANYTQVFRKAMEFVAFRNLKSDKELLSQISYSKKKANFLKELKKASDFKNKNVDTYNFKIESWKLIICLEYLNEKDINFKDKDKLLKEIIDENLKIYFNLFPEKKN